MLRVALTDGSGVIRSVPVGPKPGNPAIAPDGGRIYVCVGSRASIDIRDRRLRNAQSDRESCPVWATAGDSVAVFSMPDLKRVLTIAVSAGTDAIAFTPDGKLVFISNTGANSVSEIDAATYKEIARIPAGKAPKQMVTAE
jgi:YVTN family beta-propeller protein